MQFRAGLFVLIVFAATLSGSGQKDTVIVRPVEINDVLTNPGMGITTFQRFNGQELNPPYEWSERGPTEKLPDAANKPDFPDTSIAYLRWYWSALEPEHGKFRWDVIDLALEEARKHHQTLAIRLMPYSDRDPLPEWYRTSGARRANQPSGKDGAIWQPDFGDPLYLKFWGELVAEAGKRYDGNPTLDSVDISSIGYWGEGWSDYMPAFSAQQPLIDLWFRNFHKTQLIMNFDEPHALAYGTQHGAGWRLDCLGDMKPGSAEMLDIYPQQVVRTAIQDVWQHAPVTLETCGTPSTWKRDGYDVHYILNQALRWHISSLNVKSSPVPQEWKEAFEDFQKHMGYRLILRRLEYPASVKLGAKVPISMWWLNAGVAPIYRQYSLAIELRSARKSVVLPVPADLTKWLPGDAVVDQSISIPRDIPSGSYRLRIALLDPATGQPAIALAVKGRQPDGWYDMGPVELHP